MCSIECSRCLRGVPVLYTYHPGLPINNGILPASNFDILARSALAAHVRRGSDNPISTRLYRKYFAGDHTLHSFFKPEQPFYNLFYRYSKSLRGAVISSFELRHVELGQMCRSGAFNMAEHPRSRAASQGVSRAHNEHTPARTWSQRATMRGKCLRWQLANPNTALSVA